MDLSNPHVQPQIAHFSQPGTSADVQFAQPYATAQRFITPSSPTTAVAGPIRRRRFSAAKIQPTRIKKVMQADEEIGRMVASVPVAIGRAMEHFAEKFLLAAATVTQNSNSRTLTPAHMKQAMLNNPHFRFLEGVLGEIAIPGMPGGMPVRPMELEMPSSADVAAAWNNVMSPVCSPMDIQQMQGMSPMDVVLSPAALVNHIRSAAGLHHLGYPMHPSAMTTEAMKLLVGGGAPMIPSENVAHATGDVSADEKQAAAGGEVVEKPKRGRPRKVKKEFKCLDDDLCKEVTTGLDQEDKDRELMPPPALPMGLPRGRAKQVA